MRAAPSPQHESPDRIVTLTLEDLEKTSIVQCEDGEVLVLPELGLIEIDSELLGAWDVLELADALANALESVESQVAGPLELRTTKGWHVAADDAREITVNGSLHTAADAERHLRSLKFAARLLSIGYFPLYFR